MGVASTEAQVATQPAAENLDESAFRTGLRDRGLTDWLEQYLADTPPIDEVDAQLRRREQYLAEAAKFAPAAPQRRRSVAKASAILATLIAEHPKHSARLRWRLELARDFLERAAPMVFDRLLLYELPGRDRTIVGQLSIQAIHTLTLLRQEIAETWSLLESLDEQAIDARVASGSLGGLEMIDAQSAMLLAWARLYGLLSGQVPESQRAAELAKVRNEVTDRHGWTELPAGHETQQCSALMIAAVASRLAGDTEEADRCARQVITTFERVSNRAERQRLHRSALLAILEQIRAMRDGGKLDEALAAVNQARQWAQQTRPKDIPAALALAFAEHRLLARQADIDNDVQSQASATSPSAHPAETTSFWQPDAVLAPLERFAARSLTHRDALYAALAPATTDPALAAPESVLARQLFLGAVVMDMVSPPPDAAHDTRKRLTQAIEAAQKILASQSPDIPHLTRGELLFLMGRAHYLDGHRMQAIASLADLVEQIPDHDRSATAAEQGAAIAQEYWSDPRHRDSPTARAAFIRAARLLRKRLPTSDRAQRLQYFIALALENSGELEAAADEYAAVPASDSNVLRAYLGRARCLCNALHIALTKQTPSQADLRDLSESAIQAARQGMDFAAKQPDHPRQAEHRCLAAQIALILAGLLNHPAVARPAEAIETLKSFEAQYADCPDALGPALRQRISGLRQLKRLAEANAVVDRYLATDPESAGPVMAHLLQAMRDEINDAADKGDDQAAMRTATEAVQLSGRLLQWSQDQPDRIQPHDLLKLSIWRAWSLLNAGQPKDALEFYKKCQNQVASRGSPSPSMQIEIQIGQAECLLALDKTADALPLFTTVWQQSPEHSPHWWRALVGSLQCHSRLGSDPIQIRQTIRQQRHLAPDLGGPKWKRALDHIEKTHSAGKKAADNTP